MSTEPSRPARRRTVHDLQKLREENTPIVVATAYDFPLARLLDESGVDLVLVGDSLGMVVQGHDSTIPVTLDHMVYHAEMVGRAVRNAHVTVDLPFLSADVSPEQALISAGRLMQEGRAQSVKLEGGRRVLPQVRRLVESGVPVMGHLGLTPQSVHAFGGYRTQATDEAAQEILIEDALALQDAGAFALVLEKVPADFARRATERLSIPTIGIGAGPGCSGQVLVSHDFLGLFDEFRPKFVRRYADLADQIRSASANYADDVRNRRFPSDDESF
ncbi:MAG: 3-methyl-2-oxobutanoate hydroxymethyltransferase [Planctomycetota bacterium]